MSVLDALQRLIDAELAAEGITPELLAMVDLSVAYSPVIAVRGETIDAAVPVRPWGFVGRDQLPEKFEVQHPLIKGPVDRESLTVMRARYLLARDEYYGPALHHLIKKAAEC